MSDALSDSQFFTVGDVAKVLEVSSDRVRDLARSGQLPALRTRGGVRLFEKRDVDRLVAARAERRAR